MTCDPNLIACQISQLNEILGRVNWLTQIVLPTLSIAATLLLGIAALRSSSLANKLAMEAREHARRDERRRYGVAVQAYFDSRQQDLRSGAGWNRPHLTHAAEAVAKEINAPNSTELLLWVTTSLDRVLKDNDDHRGLHCFWLSTLVPLVIAAWVNSPEAFSEPPFEGYPEVVARLGQN